MQNPQQGMEQMFGNNPVFQQARKMAEGKSPEQMKETVLNLAKTQGVDIQLWHSKGLKWFRFTT